MCQEPAQLDFEVDLAHGTSAPSNDEHAFASRRFLRTRGRQLAERAAHVLFMNFGKLAGKASPTIGAKRLCEVSKCFSNAIGRLKKN